MCMIAEFNLDATMGSFCSRACLDSFEARITLFIGQYIIQWAEKGGGDLGFLVIFYARPRHIPKKIFCKTYYFNATP